METFIVVRNDNILVILIILIMLGATGCMRNTKVGNEKMISYLEEKYDDEFTYIDSFGGSFEGTSYQILVSSKKIPDVKITVGYYKNDEGEYYTDNYMQYKYKMDVEEFISQILTNATGTDVIISYGISTTGTKNDYTSKTSFEEFIKSSNSRLLFNAVVSSECDLDINKNEIEQRIRSVLCEKSIVCVADIYFANTKDEFMSFEEISTFTLERMSKLSISMDKKNSFTTFEWR